MSSKKSAVLFPAVVAGFAVVLAVTSSANAVPTEVTILNPSFEERENYDPFPESTDKYNQWGSETWRHFEVDNNGGPLRIWNPGVLGVDETAQGIADVGFGGNASDGKYVVVARSRYNDDEFHDPPQPRDFEAAVQLLEATFDSTKTYTLTADVGRLPNGAAEGGSINYAPSWYGYSLQFAVGGTNVDGATYQARVEGGTLLAEDHNSLTVPINSWVTSTVTYIPDPADSIYDGEQIQIRLAVLEDPADHSLTQWAAWDNVKLMMDDYVAVSQDGDYNSDGTVEAGDLALLLSNWGQTVQAAGWTSNWDGFVDANELADLLSNWGAGLSSVPLLDMAAINAVVPEPATMTLLALGGLAALRRRK